MKKKVNAVCLVAKAISYMCYNVYSSVKKKILKQLPVNKPAFEHSLGKKRPHCTEEAVCINTILVVNCLFQWISDIQPSTAK